MFKYPRNGDYNLTLDEGDRFVGRTGDFIACDAKYANLMDAVMCLCVWLSKDLEEGYSC